MPKYVLSVLVKPKSKNLLSVLRYRLPRLRGKRHNQRVATFWRHKSIEIDRLNYKLVSICSPIRSKNKTYIIWQKSSLQMHGFLHEMRKCCIFRCAENQCWGCRELKQSLSSIWSPVLAYVWHCMLWFFFCCCCCCFFFFCCCCFVFNSDLPSTHCTTCWSDCHKNIVFVRPSVRSSVVSLWM